MPDGAFAPFGTPLLAAGNDSRYGYGGAIFARDEDKALRLARDHVETGMIRINAVGTAGPNMPLGNAKDSGYGREHGGLGMTVALA